MTAADETILAAAFPDTIGALLRLCENDTDLREVCEDFVTMARLATQSRPDAAVEENLIELKQEIEIALERVGKEKPKKGRGE